jgi:hypothetical protein
MLANDSAESVGASSFQKLYENSVLLRATIPK